MPIKEIIGISCFALLIADTSGIMQKIKWYWYHKVFLNSQKQIIKIPSWKPLDCPKCLSFWIAIIFFFFNKNTLAEIILYSSTCHILALLLSNVIRRTIQ